jgi:hypothetical protein
VDHHPDPACVQEDGTRVRLIQVASGHPDSNLALRMKSGVAALTTPLCWVRVSPLHLCTIIEQAATKEDTDPKPRACHGLLVHFLAEDDRPQDRVRLRFVDGRPVSNTTAKSLDWCWQEPGAASGRVLAMLWHNASWRVSRELKGWTYEHI